MKKFKEHLENLKLFVLGIWAVIGGCVILLVYLAIMVTLALTLGNFLAPLFR